MSNGSAMDGRAPCGFLLSFGGGGGIIGICRGDVGERTGASRGGRDSSVELCVQ